MQMHLRSILNYLIIRIKIKVNFDDNFNANHYSIKSY